MYNLDEILENRCWIKRSKPFNHIIAGNVFKPTFYKELEIAFGHYVDQINRPVADGNNNNRLSRSKSGYDAYTLTINHSSEKIFHFFFSLQWHNILASLYNTNSNGFISLSLHYHETGSKNGWIHNDLNPGWYVDADNNKSIKIINPLECNYKTGETYKEGAKSIECIRSLAMIYYLNNQQRRKEDGGGTALFSREDALIENADAIVPPVNNSILIFPCTPYSYHTFVSNKYHPRSSVIMWLHTAKKNIVDRWGENKIVKWK